MAHGRNSPERVHGRNSQELGGGGVWDNKQVDSHRFLLGRERAPPEACQDILGRRPGDAQQLFPKFTSASVTTTGQVEVNGKSLNLWTYQQLETLAAPVLRQRANAIRDAVGEAHCLPMPCGQKGDLIRWIIEMQAELTHESPTMGRGKSTGAANAVPPSFFQEAQARRSTAPAAPPPLFGPRRGQDHDGTRDHYNDLKYQQNEFEQAPNAGIVTNRLGGEGRRHLRGETHMDGFGLSGVDNDTVHHIRYLGCDDHLMKQKKDLEGGLQEAVRQRGGLATRATQSSIAHPSDSHLTHHGMPTDDAPDSPVCGDRRRHIPTSDRMMGVGMADPGQQESIIGGTRRRHMDHFNGGRHGEAKQGAGGYQSTWKTDPSRLKGTSMLC